MLKKPFISIITSLILTIPLVSAAQTTTPQVSDLQTQVRQLEERIKTLLEYVASLQTQLKTTEKEIAEVKAELKLTRSLRIGTTGEDVKKLQELLKQFPDIYPEGLVTGFFGPLTEAAVKKLQEKQGIEIVGVVGPKTLIKINELLSEGAGASGVIPHGLLTAPGIQKEIETIATPTVTPPATVTPLTSTTTSIIAATSTQPVASQTTATAAGAVSPKTSAFLPVTTIVSQLPQKPWDVVVSDSDYIVTTVDLDKNMGRLLRITQDGKISTIAALSKRLSGIAISNSDYYILDGDTNLLKISPDGTVATIASLVNAGIGTGVNSQNDITVSGSDFIVTDFVGGRLLRITPIGNVSIITGDLRHPNSVLTDGSNFIVIAADNNMQPYLYRVSQKGNVSPIASLAKLGSSLGSVIKMGSDFYANSTSTIARISPNGTATLLPISFSEQGQYQLINLASNDSKIIVTDYGLSRLLQITPSLIGTAVTATPSGTIPAIPATPAVPVSSVTATQPVISATPATPATPTTQTTTTPTTSTTTTPSTTIATSTPTTISTITQVQGLAATVSGNSVTLSWQAASASTGIGVYNIYRSTTTADFIPSATSGIPSSQINLIAQGNVLSYTDSNRSPATYYYKVAAQDINGVVGPASVAVSAVITDTIPPTISSVSTNNISQTGAIVSWSTNELSDSFIEYGISLSYGQTSQNTSFAPTSHILNITGLTANTLYHYRVKSKDSNGNEAMSSDYTFSTLATVTSMTSTGCNSVDFEDVPTVAMHFAGTYSDANGIAWMTSKGLDITGTPAGTVFSTQSSGGAGKTGVTIGFASPNFAEQDGGISDDEVLTIKFLNETARTVSVVLASIPSTTSLLNNQPSTVVMEAFNESDTLIGSATKTFTGVTNGTYTPSVVNLSIPDATIKKITLKATQHPYEGVWIEKVDFGASCPTASNFLNPPLGRDINSNLANILNALSQAIENLKNIFLR